MLSLLSSTVGVLGGGQGGSCEEGQPPPPAEGLAGPPSLRPPTGAGPLLTQEASPGTRNEDDPSGSLLEGQAHFADNDYYVSMSLLSRHPPNSGFLPLSSEGSLSKKLVIGAGRQAGAG